MSEHPRTSGPRACRSRNPWRLQHHDPDEILSQGFEISGYIDSERAECSVLAQRLFAFLKKNEKSHASIKMTIGNGSVELTSKEMPSDAEHLRHLITTFVRSQKGSEFQVVASIDGRAPLKLDDPRQLANAAEAKLESPSSVADVGKPTPE